MIDRQELGLAGGLIKGDGHDLPVLDGDHAAILPVCNKLCGGSAELCCQNAVIGARRTAALIVAGHGHTRFLTEGRLDLSRYLVGNSRVLGLFAPSAAFLLGEYLIVDALCTLCNGED